MATHATALTRLGVLWVSPISSEVGIYMLQRKGFDQIILGILSGSHECSCKSSTCIEPCTHKIEDAPVHVPLNTYRHSCAHPHACV